MIDRATISNPRTHYGAGKPATRQFIVQRVTGALAIVFTIFLVWFVVSLAGTDTAGKIALVRNPPVAIGLILLVVTAVVHMRIGMIEVIEDYIDHGPRNRLAMTANTVFSVLVAVLAIGAIAKIVFWG